MPLGIYLAFLFLASVCYLPIGVIIVNIGLEIDSPLCYALGAYILPFIILVSVTIYVSSLKKSWNSKGKKAETPKEPSGFVQWCKKRDPEVINGGLMLATFGWIIAILIEFGMIFADNTNGRSTISYAEADSRGSALLFCVIFMISCFALSVFLFIVKKVMASEKKKESKEASSGTSVPQGEKSSSEPQQSTDEGQAVSIEGKTLAEAWVERVRPLEFHQHFQKGVDTFHNILGSPQAEDFLRSSYRVRDSVDEMISAMRAHRADIEHFEHEYIGSHEGDPKEVPADETAPATQETVQEIAQEQSEVVQEQATPDPSEYAPEQVKEVWDKLVDFERFYHDFAHDHELLDEVFRSPKGEAYMQSSPKPRLKVDHMIELLMTQRYNVELFEERYIGSRTDESKNS